MQNKPVLWLIGSDCPPEKEKKFNEWYDKIHIPMILKCPGVIKASRYEAVGVAEGYPKYLAVYELENEAAIEPLERSQEMAAARQERRETWGEWGEEGGFTVSWRVRYRPIGP